MFKSKLKLIIEMKKLLTFLIILTWFDGWGQEDCGVNATKETTNYLKNLLQKRALQNQTNSVELLPIIYIAVKFHISDETNISNQKINDLMFEVNRYYAPSKIQFFIREIQEFDGSGTIFYNGDSDNYFSGYSQSPNHKNNAINIYIEKVYKSWYWDSEKGKYDYGIFCGESPFFSTDTTNAGNVVFVQEDCLNEHKTLTHELGHYFFLFHTHQTPLEFVIRPNEPLNGRLYTSNCGDNGVNSFGDLLCDTPADNPNLKISPSECEFTNTLIDANGDTYNPQKNNIMGYHKSSGCPRSIFTQGQIDRVRLIGLPQRTNSPNYNITTLPSNQNPPTNITSILIQNNIKVNWTDNSTSETGYLIERSTNPNDGFVCIGGVAPNITTFTDNTILPNTNYYYRVRASNATIYNCNTSPVTPYLSGERTVITSNWYAQDVQKATRLGLMDKNNWTNDVVSDNSNITVGEVARSLVITANLLNITGFNAVNPICWDNNPNNAYVAHLKNNNFLPSSVQSNDLITKGLLCDLIKNIIFESNTTYPYQVTRPDMSSIIASTAPYKSSIEYLYQRIGFVKSSNGKKLGDYFFNGKYISTLNNRKIVGTENVTRAIFAKFIATAYEFKYYQLNQKVVPNARIAQTNSVFDDIIIIGSKAEFDNDITGIPPTVTVDGTTEFLRSGQRKNFSFSTDQLSDGTKVFFYWNIDGGSQGLQLVPMPQYSTNFQGVILTAPIVTSPQVFQFYIHISTIDGRTAEMFKDIMVVPNDPNNNTNLTTGEYFVDNDLGIGQATVLPITLNNYGVDATIPIPTNNLTQGIHTVGIRVKDSNNKWSITHTKTFLVLGIGTGSGSQITQIGYFFDSQNAENIANVSVDANNQIALPITVNLTQGIHTVSFRVKDSQNKWSLYHTRTFLVLGQGSGGSNAITQVEYFFDADPLEANRIRQNLTLDANNQVIIPLNISLPQGIHTVSFRVKDGQDKWSIFHTRTFLVIGSGSGNATISTIEYFMDSDPGFGNGTQVAYATTNNQAVLLNVNVGSLTHGVHVLFVRVKNSLNQWSLTHAKAFVVMPNLGSSSSISRVEYFIDDANPSLGNGISANFIPNPTSSDVLATFDLNISQLSLGIHRINVRTKDNNNQWSSLVTANFEIIQIPCPQNKTITETESSGQLIHQASSTVNLQNTTYNGTVKGEIKAGGSITIGPNTTFDAGTVIKIYVGGCANN